MVEDMHLLDDGASSYLQDLVRTLGARSGPRPSLLLTARPSPRRLELERAEARSVTPDLEGCIGLFVSGDSSFREPVRFRNLRVTPL